MQCPNCNSPLEDNATFCGICGKQVAPLQAQGATVITQSGRPLSPDEQPTLRSNARFTPQTSLPAQDRRSAPPYQPPPETPARGDTPLPPSRNPLSRRTVLIIGVATILLALIAVSIFGLLKGSLLGGGAGSQAKAVVAFVDGQNGTGHTDALSISASGLASPAAGSQYDAWLVDEQSERILPLGTLQASGQLFLLNYAGDGSSGQAGTNLIGAGNKIEITQEQGKVSSPSTQVLLSASFPPKAFIHIRHLLFSFPSTPGKIGLLVGLQEQAQLLDSQALILQTIAAKGDSFGIQCAAQSIINIIEGSQGQHYVALGQACIQQNVTANGDGFGLLSTSDSGYVALAASHAHLAATQPDSTSTIILHAGHVQIATNNIQQWLTTIEQDALALYTTPSNTEKVSEIVTLSDHAYHGVDINSDEHVDPVPGEAGAITAYIHGQLMATLTLTPGA